MSEPNIRLAGKKVVLVAPFTVGLLTDEEYEQFVKDGFRLTDDKLAQVAQEYKAAKASETVPPTASPSPSA